MRVRDWRLHGGPDVLVHLIARAGSLDVEMVRAVMEARGLLLSESARLAASRRSPEQAALLASLAGQLVDAGDDEAAQHLDFAWYAVLIEAAGNVDFLLVMHSIRALYLDHLELFRPIVSRRAELVPPYRAAARHATLGRPPILLPLGRAVGGTMAQFGLMVHDDSRGRVHSVGGHAVVRYDISDADTARVKRGLEHLAELFWAAGARSVLLPIARLQELHDGDSAPLCELDLRPEDLKLMAFHPLGSARMDARPSHGVLDGDGRVQGTEGVYVCDGSAIPSSLGVNPQITIMTLATRLAAHLCRS